MGDAGGRGSNHRGSRPQARDGGVAGTEVALPGGGGGGVLCQRLAPLTPSDWQRAGSVRFPTWRVTWKKQISTVPSRGWSGKRTNPT